MYINILSVSRRAFSKVWQTDEIFRVSLLFSTDSKIFAPYITVKKSRRGRSGTVEALGTERNEDHKDYLKFWKDEIYNFVKEKCAVGSE